MDRCCWTEGKRLSRRASRGPGGILCEIFLPQPVFPRAGGLEGGQKLHGPQRGLGETQDLTSSFMDRYVRRSHFRSLHARHQTPSGPPTEGFYGQTMDRPQTSMDRLWTDRGEAET